MKTRFTAPLQARNGDPRGQVLVLFALMLVVLLLVSALAVDYGGWLVAKRNYQNVSDAAALAGAQQLTRPLTAACPNGRLCAASRIMPFRVI
jgi:Flp pilus assembly protein TadG